MSNLSNEQLVKFVGMSQRRFLYGLEAVPDDRLSWSPSEGGRTILEFADYVARFLGIVTILIREGTMPKVRPSTAPPSASREEAVDRLTGVYGALQSAVRDLPEEKLSSMMIPPWQTEMSVAEMLWFVSSALGYFQGQLNLYQMCYGDAEPHIPPGWGAVND